MLRRAQHERPHTSSILFFEMSNSSLAPGFWVAVVMKIIVLNGSPKGTQSVTMQYVNFIQKKFPQHELKILNIAQRIQKIEKDEPTFQEILDEVRSSAGVFWAFPLYIMLVHAGYKRFIELIWEREVQDVFQGKYASAIATSIHFYDHTALKYIQGICDDLGMKYVDAFSAEMRDLMKENGRKKCMLFAENFFETIENKLPAFPTYQPVSWQSSEYLPGSLAEENVNAGSKKVLIVTDSEDEQTNLGKMVARCKQVFSKDIEVVNLSALDIKGGCQGCMQCAYDNTCVWAGKDDFIEFYETKIKTADILIFAGTIQDRYLSSRWKTFFDRSFYNTHIPTIIGKQIGWILSGPLSQIANLRHILEALAEISQAHLVDIVTDENGNSAEIDARLHSLAERSVRFAEKEYLLPPTFLKVGGMKIFRDGVYGGMRLVFQADHKFYKEHGYYDFPQKDYKTRLLAAIVSLLLKIPAFRKRFYAKEMKPGMIRGLQKVVSQA